MRYKRQSLRLSDHDYGGPGSYSVTIFVKNRMHLLGCVEDDGVVNSASGDMIEKWYKEIPERFSKVVIDEYVTMPNHIHFIIHIKYDDPEFVLQGIFPLEKEFQIGAEVYRFPTHDNVSLQGTHMGEPLRDTLCKSPSLGEIVGWFKTMTTNEYIRGVKSGLWPPFDGKLWHRNYFETIIRSYHHYGNIKNYIRTNPERPFG